MPDALKHTSDALYFQTTGPFPSLLMLLIDTLVPLLFMAKHTLSSPGACIHKRTHTREREGKRGEGGGDRFLRIECKRAWHHHVGRRRNRKVRQAPLIQKRVSKRA